MLLGIQNERGRKRGREGGRQAGREAGKEGGREGGRERGRKNILRLTHSVFFGIIERLTLHDGKPQLLHLVD